MMRPRLAVFGDSHYACLRLAHGQGLVDLSALDVEYWGHIGKRFRALEFRDGAIHPTDPVTAARFAKFNEKGRLFLPAADFDAVLFMGCRIDLAAVFMGLVDAQMRGLFLTQGLRRAMLRARLNSLPAYGFAVAMAAEQRARILLHPVTMFGLGTADYDALVTDAMKQATPAARAAVMGFIGDEMAKDGVHLLPQQDATFAGGIYTNPEYLVEGHAQTNDYTHRTAAYGALVWQQVLDALA